MQLQQGLNNCGVLASAIKYPKLWEPVFTASSRPSMLTAEEFLDGFVVNFSTTQVLKQKEIDIFKLFSDFVESLDEEGIKLDV